MRPKQFPEHWTQLDRINFLQRVIILNSILYYELDSPLMSDQRYDALSRQLVAMQAECDINDTEYGYCMHDFDGTTGFDLYSRLNDSDREYLLKMAKNLVEVNKVVSKVAVQTRKKRGKLF